MAKHVRIRLGTEENQEKTRRDERRRRAEQRKGKNRHTFPFLLSFLIRRADDVDEYDMEENVLVEVSF